jgi:threonine dehydrogenase-like Zn-dependent dehydrogenase
VIGVNINMAFPFPLGLAFLRNLTIRLALAPVPSAWDSLIPLLLHGRLRPDDVFTHRLGLSQAPRAYQLFAGHEDGCLKVLLDPAG